MVETVPVLLLFLVMGVLVILIGRDLLLQPYIVVVAVEEDLTNLSQLVSREEMVTDLLQVLLVVVVVAVNHLLMLAVLEIVELMDLMDLALVGKMMYTLAAAVELVVLDLVDQEVMVE
jgi:hypothetical protein